jgi:hypothetical protein
VRVRDEEVASGGLRQPETRARAYRTTPSVARKRSFGKKTRINAVLYQIRANAQNVKHDEP